MRTTMDLSAPPQALVSLLLQQQSQHNSPWHSPVTYLFGGLAAMLGLIAFALLILACSYWKLSGYLDGANARDDIRSLESTASGGKPLNGGRTKLMPTFEEKVVVIMAGDNNPTFLATPMTGRACSSEDDRCKSDNGEAHRDKKRKGEGEDENDREGVGRDGCDPKECSEGDEHS